MDAPFGIDMKIARMGSKDDAAGSDRRKGFAVTDDARSDGSRCIVTSAADDDGLREKSVAAAKAVISVPVTSGDS